MKKTFFAGLVTLLPIAVTLLVFFFIFDALTTPFVGFVKDLITYYRGGVVEIHPTLLLFISRVIVLILLVIFVFLLGILGKRILFSYLLKLTHRIFIKIPIVKTIYRITRDITKNVLSTDKKKLFKGTALVPFPHEKTHALGLLSGEPPTEIQKKDDKRIKDKDLQAVFVPTAPHPISGFLLMYASEEVKTVDIQTEDVFKFLLSCGIYQPSPKKTDDKTKI